MLLEHCLRFQVDVEAKNNCIVVGPQAYAKKSALKGGLDMTVSLRKEMQEMQEWITQAEEEYLERDFQYKTPEELFKAVEELKVCSSVENFVAPKT